MPLRCINPEGDTSILAFDLTLESWRVLEAENRRRRHLRMPCCAAKVTLRRSKHGMAHFVHKTVGCSTTASETETHLWLKRMAVEAAREQGWEAQTEVVGQTPGGEPWRSDVLAWFGKSRVALEVQWSSQTGEETMRRQERYRVSGVRALWLFRQGSFPVDEALPAAHIGGTVKEGLTAVLPGERPGSLRHGGGQEIPMAEFLAAAFGRRLRFGLPLDVPAHFLTHTGRLFCWACGAETPILTWVEVRAGRHVAQVTVPRLGEHPQLWKQVRGWLPTSFSTNAIRPRYSRTQKRSYLSNGCHHCDALIGEFFEHDAWDDQEVIHEITAPLDEAWREAMVQDDGAEACWGVF